MARAKDTCAPLQPGPRLWWQQSSHCKLDPDESQKDELIIVNYMTTKPYKYIFPDNGTAILLYYLFFQGQCTLFNITVNVPVLSPVVP